MATMHNKCPTGQSFNAQQTEKWRGKLERKMRYVRVINKQKKIDQWAFNGPKRAAHLMLNKLKREREKNEGSKPNFQVLHDHAIWTSPNPTLGSLSYDIS